VVHGRGCNLRAPKLLKIQVFRGHPALRGRTASIFYGTQLDPDIITYVQVWSKSDQRQLRKTLHKQTDKPTDTTKIMVTWPWTNNIFLQQICHEFYSKCNNGNFYKFLSFWDTSTWQLTYACAHHSIQLPFSWFLHRPLIIKLHRNMIQ